MLWYHVKITVFTKERSSVSLWPSPHVTIYRRKIHHSKVKNNWYYILEIRTPNRDTWPFLLLLQYYPHSLTIPNQIWGWAHVWATKGNFQNSTKCRREESETRWHKSGYMIHHATIRTQWYFKYWKFSICYAGILNFSFKDKQQLLKDVKYV